jgi:Diacylglycerol kinase catalytic domain
MPATVSVGLIVNIAARKVKNRYLGHGAFWRELLPDHCVRVTGSLDELERATADFQERGVRVLAGLGGDGTLHHLVDTLLRQYGADEVPLVLGLAGGTMNGLPRALGSGGPPARVLRSVIDALAEGDPPPFQTRHVLRITDTAGGRSVYGFGFAAGLIFRAYQEYYRSSEPGLADALRASLLPVRAALLGGSFFDPVLLEVRAAGTAWYPGSVQTVVASVTDNPFLWLRPFGTPLGEARAFHFAATSMGAREMAPRLWSILRGHCSHPRLRVDRVSDASVTGENGYIVDGDLYFAKERFDLSLTVGPPVRFVLPNEARRRMRVAPEPRDDGTSRQAGSS